MDIKDIFLGTDEYFLADFKKTIIYLHHTCGSCFVGETLIDLVDGNSVRLDELKIGEKYWIYGCDSEGNTKIVDCVALGETKKVNELIEITLDNGEVERCTLEHEWMLRDGSYRMAIDLKEHDSLMPLYKRFDSRKYEEIKNNKDNKWYKTHQLSGKLKYGDYLYKNDKQMVLHHIDFNKLNNNPENLLLMEKNEHIMFHAKLMKDNWANDDWKLKMKVVSSNNMKNMMSVKLKDENYIKEMSERLKKRWKDGEFDYQIGQSSSNEICEKIRKTINEKWKDEEWTKKTKKSISDNSKKMWLNEEYKNKMSENSKELWKNKDYVEKVFKFDKEFNKKMWASDEHRKKISDSMKNYNLYKKSEFFNKISYKEYKDTYNHKILKIEIIKLKESVSVYDIYSPITNNFALSSGVFVHNSRPDWVIQGWDQDSNEDGSIRKIATSFVIGGKSTRDGDSTWDGVVTRCFPETKWAFHLGVKNTNGMFDKISIGIEICNYGELTKSKSGQFMTYVNTPVPENQVVELAKPFRNYRYYHKYTDKQLDSLRQLLLYLSNKFSINLKLGLVEWINKENLIIPNGLSILQQQQWLNQYGFVGKNGLPLAEDGSWGENTAYAIQSIGRTAFEYNPLTMRGYPGIWTHTNIRPTDKSDCSPQPNLISMLKSL